MIEKQRLLIIDDCILQSCNLKCAYCRPDRINTISSETASVINRSIEIAKQYVDAPILKLSGYGEITLVRDFASLLEQQEDSFEKLQIITNGSLLTEETIKRLAKINGLCVCVSLDGHTFPMNSGRVGMVSIHERILNNLQHLGEYGIPIEINSVLTAYNAKDFIEFLDYLLCLPFPLTCYPFPVRQNFLYAKDYRYLQARDDMLKTLKYITEHYDRFSAILPHKEYIISLREYLSNEKRCRSCYISYINLGITPQANIIECACGLNNIFGNIFTSPEEAFAKREIRSDVIENYRMPLGCQDCFTHYDIINLYMDGTIGLSDLSRLTLFNGEKTKERLIELRERAVCANDQRVQIKTVAT